MADKGRRKSKAPKSKVDARAAPEPAAGKQKAPPPKRTLAAEKREVAQPEPKVMAEKREVAPPKREVAPPKREVAPPKREVAPPKREVAPPKREVAQPAPPRPATRVVAGGAEPRPRVPFDPTPEWSEPPEPAADMLVEGFFLTPTPRHRQVPAEPISEGFFVARIAGEQAARRHGLTSHAAHPQPKFDEGFDEKLGELPQSYGEDDVIALPRDPHSMFFFWDLAPAASAAGAPPPTAVLRVYEGDQLIREVPFGTDQRSFYLHDLPAGRTFRLEAHVVEASGASRRIGAAKLVTLPSDRPVRTTEVRFLKLPWHLALAALRDYLRDGKAEVEVVAGKEAFTAWIRTALPSSAELLEGIVTQPSGLGEELESPGQWRPTPSGHSFSA